MRHFTGMLAAVCIAASCGTATAVTEVYTGTTFNTTGGVEVCMLTVEKDASGKTTLMRVAGWGQGSGTERATRDEFGPQEVVVTADNTSDEMVEEVTFEKTLSFKHWGFHNVAWEETKPKWTWDASRWLGALIRDVRYVVVKGDYEELKARQNIYLLGRTASVGNTDIDCEALTKRA
eukprot:TRINITY_DN5994_c0_g1_i8.p2 TRINITY_DN5994_c0_g1~~TRINITY_DN5994_c0_g1_i8.p2  ORF type:complete len:199 (+),score=98.06 TRINITY_DN5994_c0_g1_i8:68-598(+)